VAWSNTASHWRARRQWPRRRWARRRWASCAASPFTGGPRTPRRRHGWASYAASPVTGGPCAPRRLSRAGLVRRVLSRARRRWPRRQRPRQRRAVRHQSRRVDRRVVQRAAHRLSRAGVVRRVACDGRGVKSRGVSGRGDGGQCDIRHGASTVAWSSAASRLDWPRARHRWLITRRTLRRWAVRRPASYSHAASVATGEASAGEASASSGVSGAARWPSRCPRRDRTLPPCPSLRADLGVPLLFITAC
jgi:hypothetical protein